MNTSQDSCARGIEDRAKGVMAGRLSTIGEADEQGDEAERSTWLLSRADYDNSRLIFTVDGTASAYLGR